MKDDWKRAIRAWNAYPAHEETIDVPALQRLLEAQNRIYSHLGSQGEEFLELMRLASPHESYDPELESMAARYDSHASEGALAHAITYGPLALRDPHGLFQTRTHEFVHAIHCHTLAPFQAIPGNHHSPVILSPADACLLMELAERAAFTIERLFKLKHKMALRPNAEVSAMEYGFLHSPDITIPQHAASYLENIALGHDNYTGLMYYRDMALDIYQADILRREQTSTAYPPVIARLSAADILATGHLLGLDLFAPQPFIPAYSTDSLPVTNQQDMKLQHLENWIGITRQQDLPTLAEALSDLGYTEEGYLREQQKLQKRGRPYTVKDQIKGFRL